MISEATLSGYVLEEVLARLLRENGYTLLVRESQDRDALRDGKHGLLVRGRGTDHQADALGELLIPAPFSLPVRLFAEAKFKGDPVGISDVRNALGVLNDVNEHYASEAMHDFPMRRYQYRYALFSASGFTFDAQKYALAHQISLIDLQGPAFTDLRGFTSNTARRLLRLAQSSGLSTFPLNQMRTALRRALRTWSNGEGPEDSSYEAAKARASTVTNISIGDTNRLSPDDLALIAADLDEELTDRLMLGFPQGPFILVLQPDDPEAFDDFLNKSTAEIDVDIRYASSAGAGGEWVIMPQPRREELAVRFGIPPLLEAWLLAEDDVDRERVRLARRTLFSSVALFHHDNRLTQLRYRKVTGRRLMADEVLTEAVPTLRRELAEPDLAFKGRRERVPDEWYQDSEPLFFDPGPTPDLDALRRGRAAPSSHEEWTLEGITELLLRLDRERPLQAAVIRTAAAKRNGRITRRQVYRLGGFDPNRSLRGFTRPSNRITQQLQREGIVSPRVDFPLRAVYGKGGQATHFIVPPEFVRPL
jgi:Restriction endonuclease